MSTGTHPSTAENSAFGSFLLHPLARRLEKDGAPVTLGGRALDILVLLVARAGEVVSHHELQSAVWPNVLVEQSSLRVQMNLLRKALGETDEGGQYIINITGRGYCFVAPVTRILEEPSSGPANAETSLPRLKPLVGRDQVIRRVIAQLVEKRFVTLVGTGGVGKTAVAVAAAAALVPAFNRAVYFLDLGEVTSPHAAHVMLGRAALRRIVVAEGAVQGLADSLRGKRLLIVLDCCDRIAGAMGELAATLLRATRDVHVLATSRERLGGDGETVISLPPLATPPDAATLPAAALAEYAGVKLMTHLISRFGGSVAPSDADLRAMANMTRRLDGLPLALELAAAGIAQNGVEQTSSMIDSRFALFMTSLQATMPRHASLSATLEWGYDQLTTEQKMIFRSLSVFSGPFAMDGVRHVAADVDMDEQAVTTAFMALLAKSMIAHEAGNETLRYRMLDTTRAFGMSKLLTLGEGDVVKRRHAAFMTRYLTRANAGVRGPSFGRQSETLSCNIHNIRSALEWCFSPFGEASLGARLAAASAQVFATLWLHAEGLSWAHRALSSLGEECAGTQLELDLRIAILVSACEPATFHHVQAQLPAVIALSDKWGDHVWRAEARALDIMLMAETRPIEKTIENAVVVREISVLSGDTPTRLLGDWVLGLAYHLAGVLNEVGPLCTSAATFVFSEESVFFGTAHMLAQTGALGSLARTLWLQGKCDTALRLAREAVIRLPDAANTQTLRKFLVPLFTWCGAFEDAENLLAHVDEEAAHEIDAGTAYMHAGALSLARGHLDHAVSALQEAQTRRWSVAERGIVTINLAEALALRGNYLQARRMIEQAVEMVKGFGDSFFTPERYRVLGVVLSAGPPAEAPAAEAWFLRAIACATRQGSLSFALRAATNLARFYQARGDAAQAYAMLAGIYNQFTEGFDTPDLLAARHVLDRLQRPDYAQARMTVPG